MAHSTATTNVEQSLICELMKDNWHLALWVSYDMAIVGFGEKMWE